MPKIPYIEKNFHDRTLAVIELCNRIIEDYFEQGFTLTLRQLYYRLVAGGHIANRQREYKRLGSIVNDARLAGMIDWYAIEDRTRNLSGLRHWSDPAEIIASARSSFRIDMWEKQRYRPEVWVEKDALANVIARACNPNDVPFLSCRGYMSQSEMWAAAQRFRNYIRRGQIPLVIHLGDHDPSGIDMTRDVKERLNDLFGIPVGVERIALNMDQVEEYDPPPNPAKLTDSRSGGYIASFGRSSWELDALDPPVLVDLIESIIDIFRDEDQWEEDEERLKGMRSLLVDMEELAGERWEQQQHSNGR